jgi:hypothetical protein
MKQMTIDPTEFYAERLEAGKRIDPDKAEIYFTWVRMTDPYGVYPPFEGDCIGRCWFAYTPEEGSVSFRDLPPEIRAILEKRIDPEEHKLWPFQKKYNFSFNFEGMNEPQKTDPKP